MSDINADDLEFFAGIDLFSNLSLHNIRDILQLSEQVTVSADQIIINEREMNDYYYIIRSGSCEVLEKDASDNEITVLTLEQGDSFGEEALLSDVASDYIFRMSSDGIIIKLARDDFDRLIKKPIIKKMDLKEVLEGIKNDAVLIDVSPYDIYKKTHIKGSKHIPEDQLLEQSDVLDRDKQVIVYCDDVIKSSLCAFSLAYKGYSVAFLDEGLNNYVEKGELLTLVQADDGHTVSSGKDDGQLEKELNETKKVLDEMLVLNKSITDERNELQEKCNRIQDLLRKAADTQSIFSDERRNTKKHLVEIRQDIRNDLHFMINDINEFVQKNNKLPDNVTISKEKHLEELFSLGKLVVNIAKKINSKTQWITSSTKVLEDFKKLQEEENQRELLQIKKDREAITESEAKLPENNITEIADEAEELDMTHELDKTHELDEAEELDKIEALDEAEELDKTEELEDIVNSDASNADTTGDEGENIVDLDVTNVLDIPLDDDKKSKDDDLMKRYEQTMWKTKDIKRLNLELDETHTDLILTDIEKYLHDGDKEKEHDAEELDKKEEIDMSEKVDSTDPGVIPARILNKLKNPSEPEPDDGNEKE